MPSTSYSRRLAVAVVAAIVAVPLLEGMASFYSLGSEVASLRPPPPNFRQAVYDTLLGWVGMPNLKIRDNYGPGISLTTNEAGMRIHRSVTPAIAPGERRMICSGDSFTFGSGVADSDTFCASIEPEFPGMHTLNMAQRGYGIDQAYLWYRRDAARYPHQVHLFAFIWNDFERMALRSFFGYSKPVLALHDGVLDVKNVPVPRWKGWSRWTDVPTVLPHARVMQLLEQHMDMSDSAKLARVDAEVWNTATAVFRDLARLNRANGSRLVLVYLPAPPDLVAGPYDNRREKLARFSRDSGIPFIDLTGEMRTVPADTLAWMFITPNGLPVSGSGGHYTPRGHKWVAQRLAAHLRAIPVNAALGGAQP